MSHLLPFTIARVARRAPEASARTLLSRLVDDLQIIAMMDTITLEIYAEHIHRHADPLRRQQLKAELREPAQRTGRAGENRQRRLPR